MAELYPHENVNSDTREQPSPIEIRKRADSLKLNAVIRINRYLSISEHCWVNLCSIAQLSSLVELNYSGNEL